MHTCVFSGHYHTCNFNTPYLIERTDIIKYHSLSLSLSLSADRILCNISFDLSNCTEWKDIAHLSTDPVTYMDAESTITASFDQNTTNGQHHYVFCYKYILELDPRTIDCVQGNTSVSVNCRWPSPGNADLLVLIYNSTNYNDNSFQACATTNISIACEWIFQVWVLQMTWSVVRLCSCSCGVWYVAITVICITQL